MYLFSNSSKNLHLESWMFNLQVLHARIRGPILKSNRRFQLESTDFLENS